jgi:CRISPR-associated protein Cas2
MLWIISYDIADDRRRARLAKALLNFGARLEESLFAAHVDETLGDKLRQTLQKHIHEQEDSAHIIPVCQACERKIEAFGLGQLPEERDFYIV